MKLSKLNIKKINFNDIDSNYSGQDILMKLGEDIILYDENTNIGINKEVLGFEDKDTFINKLNGLSLENMKEYNSIELGNNFELGTKYSETMNMYF